MESRVQFESGNHFQTIFQLHGSVWSKVLPFCLANVVNLYIVSFTKKHIFNENTLGISLDDFQSSLSIVIAFLSVTRVTIAFGDYIGHRGAVQSMCRACRNLVFHSVAFTRQDMGVRAKQWRLDIARESMALLRLLVTALQFESTGVEARSSAALTSDEKIVMDEYTGDDNERSAYVITMFMQSTISSHPKHLAAKLGDFYVLKLYSFVEDYIKAYNDCYAMLDTGLPFPVIQMTRTMVFLYVATLPWVMYDGVDSDLGFYSAMLYCFFVTYAFVGLEFVSIEMDDPFGDDDNDLNVLSVVEKVFKDIIMCIEDVDGDSNADLLKQYASIVDDLEKSGLQRDNSFSFDTHNDTAATPFVSKAGSKRSNLLRKASSRRLPSDSPRNGYQMV